MEPNEQEKDTVHLADLLAANQENRFILPPEGNISADQITGHGNDRFAARVINSFKGLVELSGEILNQRASLVIGVVVGFQLGAFGAMSHGMYGGSGEVKAIAVAAAIATAVIFASASF